jgi:anti-anti-sigma factor
MSGIGVREWGEEGVLVELRGEFDRHNLSDLRETLSGTAALSRPMMVDLAGVTFLDVGATRELAIRSQLYAHQLILCNPSWQVQASVAACGFGAWLNFSGSNGSTYCRAY